MVFVLSYACIVLSSDYDTFRSLLMRLSRPVLKFLKTLFGTFHVHHLLDRGLICESTKYFTNQGETKVVLIFGKSIKLIYFFISENEEIELLKHEHKCQDWHNAIML